MGQKYQEALQGEQKAAIASEEKAETAQGIIYNKKALELFAINFV